MERAETAHHTAPVRRPTLLLQHGLPSSSRMFEPLFARLSNRYHLVAPNYPGFGHSDGPDPKKFAYTFDHIAEITNHCTEALGLSHYTLYMQGYGGPVGFGRTALRLSSFRTLLRTMKAWERIGKTRRAFWADRAANESAIRTNLVSLPTPRTRLNQPGQADIQSDLFYDHRTNVENYPKWQARMREKQPRLLVMWGKYDLSFDPSEPEAYHRDVPKAEVHVLDAGHFTLDRAGDEIAAESPPH